MRDARGIDLDDEYVFTLHRKLNVHQADDIQRPSQLVSVGANGRQHLLREVHARHDAGGIARVDSSLFNMLHDARDDDILAVRQGIDVDFDGIFQKVIDQHRPLLRVFDCLPHVVRDSSRRHKQSP